MSKNIYVSYRNWLCDVFLDKEKKAHIVHLFKLRKVLLKAESTKIILIPNRVHKSYYLSHHQYLKSNAMVDIRKETFSITIATAYRKGKAFITNLEI